MNDNLQRTVWECITLLDRHFTAAVPGVIDKLKAAGAVSRIHEGKPSAWFTPETTLEWYAGQILDTLEAEKWFAVNSLINVAGKFAQYPGMTP